MLQSTGARHQIWESVSCLCPVSSPLWWRNPWTKPANKVRIQSRFGAFTIGVKRCCARLKDTVQVYYWWLPTIRWSIIHVSYICLPENIASFRKPVSEKRRHYFPLIDKRKAAGTYVARSISDRLIKTVIPDRRTYVGTRRCKMSGCGSGSVFLFDGFSISTSTACCFFDVAILQLLLMERIVVFR